MNLLRNKLTWLKSNYCELKTEVYYEPYRLFNGQLVHLDGYRYKFPHRPIHRKYVPKHIMLTNYDETVYSETDVDLSNAYEFYEINR